MLRDDYASLSFSTACYEMLHTTALAAGDADVARLALSHLRDYTPLAMEVSRVLPRVVTEELAAEGKLPVAPGAAEEAVRNTQEAWAQGAAQKH